MPSPWIGSIYLCLLCPVQRNGFIAWVPGANLAGICLEDGLGTPGKDSEMTGWVAALLTQDLHSHHHLPSAQRKTRKPCSSSRVSATPASSSAALLFCSSQKAWAQQEAYKPNSVGSRRTSSQLQVVEQHLGASLIQEYGISGNSPNLRSEILLLSFHGNMRIEL